MRHIQHFQFWQIWTPGWGPRHWARNVWREKLPMWVAWMLPHQVALWAFIRVYAATGDAPGPEYTRAYQHWEQRR